jgi:uncharacterized membrane protein YjjP (DUF1212 family)
MNMKATYKAMTFGEWLNSWFEIYKSPIIEFVTTILDKSKNLNSFFFVFAVFPISTIYWQCFLAALLTFMKNYAKILLIRC